MIGIKFKWWKLFGTTKNGRGFMSLLLIVKIILVLVFLFMFWRRANWVWGIGLLAVTLAVFFDTFWRTFGGDELSSELGFFYYVIAGLVVGGMVVWLWGLTQPLVGGGQPAVVMKAAPAAPPIVETRPAAASMSNSASAVDRQMLYGQIVANLSQDDLYDLMFDLEMAENEVVAPTQNMNQTIDNIMNLAYERGQASDLALAVERILTPVPPDHLPRLEKLSADSPPTVLRRYLLAFYFLDQLENMADELGIDWERMGLLSKQQKVRNFLLYLKRRNRVPELIEIMQRPVHEDG